MGSSPSLPFSLARGPGVISPKNLWLRSTAPRRFISLALEKGGPPTSSHVDLVTNEGNLGWCRFLEYAISHCHVMLHLFMQEPCRRWECLLNALTTRHHGIGNSSQWLFFFPQCKTHSIKKYELHLEAHWKVFSLRGVKGNQSVLLLIFLFIVARSVFRARSDGLYFTRWEVSQKCSVGLISPVQKKLFKAVWRGTVNSPVLFVHKLRSHLAAQVNDDFPVTKFILPQV